jgi:hypothetical protein
MPGGRSKQGSTAADLEVVAMTDLVPQVGRSEPPVAESERERARKRLERKLKFRADLGAYIVINAFLVGVWAFTERGYFWPGWVMAGWGVLLVLDFWNVYVRRPITEADVDRELRRGR